MALVGLYVAAVRKSVRVLSAMRAWCALGVAMTLLVGLIVATPIPSEAAPMRRGRETGAN